MTGGSLSPLAPPLVFLFVILECLRHNLGSQRDDAEPLTSDSVDMCRLGSLQQALTVLTTPSEVEAS